MLFYGMCGHRQEHQSGAVLVASIYICVPSFKKSDLGRAHQFRTFRDKNKTQHPLTYTWPVGWRGKHLTERLRHPVPEGLCVCILAQLQLLRGQDLYAL